MKDNELRKYLGIKKNYHKCLDMLEGGNLYSIVFAGKQTGYRISILSERIDDLSKKMDTLLKYLNIKIEELDIQGDKYKIIEE